MRHVIGVGGSAVISGLVAKSDNTGIGYFAGSPKDYDRAQALNVPQPFAFLRVTHTEEVETILLTEITAANEDEATDITESEISA